MSIVSKQIVRLFKLLTLSKRDIVMNCYGERNIADSVVLSPDVTT